MSSELARRIAFTLGALLIFRIGAYIPLPGTNIIAWSHAAGMDTPSLFGSFTLPAGTPARHFAIFGLGLIPYITAAIILQVVCIGSARLRALNEAGERGRAKLVTYTLCLTILMAAFQAYGIAEGLERLTGLVPQPGALFKAMTVLSLTAGTLVLVWLCNQITLRGVGNGLVLVLAISLLIDLPTPVAATFERARMGMFTGNMVLLTAVLALLVTIAIVLFEGARRVIAVDYPQQTIGGTTLESRTANLMLKVNNAGLIPTVLAGWFIVILGLGVIFGIGPESPLLRELGHGHSLFMVLFAILVVLLTLFYTAYLIDPDKMSAQLKTFGGVVRGVAPGEATADYIDSVVSRVTMLGAVYLVLIFIVPEILIVYLGLPLYLGGASFLVVICAALDFGSQLKQEFTFKAGGVSP
ncbi:MAG TPA: preprotein translocase subunit SecY [Pseudolabrys sp.]|nr:preprotein translocase subunit SecY [Pseudolabrys sp.]